MNMKYRQRYVCFLRNGVTYHSVVLAKIETDAIHLQASAYLLAKSMEGLRPNSLRAYAAAIKSLIEELEADPEISNLDEITDAHITQYLEVVLYRKRGVCAKTVDFHITVLESWFRWCYECGHSLKPPRFSYYVSPDVKLRIRKALGREASLDPFKLHHKYIPPNEFNELLAHLAGKAPLIIARNEVILRLGYESGLRASEVVSPFNLSLLEIDRAIKVAAIKNLPGFELDIIGKGSSGGKVRTVHIPDGLKRKIERFVKQYSSTLKHTQLICAKDGSMLNLTYASKIFRDSRKSLLENSDPVVAQRWENLPCRSFHSLRHSYATNLARRVYTGDLRDRVPRTLIQERLGHASPQTTAIYIHFSAVIHNDHFETQEEFAREIYSANHQWMDEDEE